MNDQEIRDQAQSFLNSQQLPDQAFFADIKRYIAEIPLDPRLLRHCFICASASCGVCGDCHNIIKQVLSFDQKHMIRENRLMVQPRGTMHCVAWIWAYLLLSDAESALNTQNH